MAWARRNLRWDAPARLRHARSAVRWSGRRLLLIAVIVFALVFQWNWLRGPLAGAISARLHRPVTISGDLEVHPWSATPWARVNGLAVGNPAWAGGGVMATLPRLTVQARLWPLLRGKLILPLVDVEHPALKLVRAADGRTNWNFSNSPTPPPLRLPAIQRLVINDGAVKLDDARRNLTFVGVISSSERVVGSGVRNVPARRQGPAERRGLQRPHHRRPADQRRPRPPLPLHSAYLRRGDTGSRRSARSPIPSTWAASRRGCTSPAPICRTSTPWRAWPCPTPRPTT